MPQLPEKVQHALESLDRSSYAPDVEAAEKERQLILQKFPLSCWPTMTVEQYALGHAAYESSYCYHLEFFTPNLGSIRGGNANKLLIFWTKKTNPLSWVYPAKYDSVEEAWSALRSGFVEALELAGKGEFEGIVEIESLHGAFALLNKTLATYFPDQFLPISSNGHLTWFCKVLERPDLCEDSPHTVILNRRLLEYIRSIPQFSNWSPKEIERFLYTNFPPSTAGNRKVLKVAPGDNAHLWDDCLANGYIRIGWGDVGDLQEFESKDEFKKRFFDAYAGNYNNNKSATSRKANEVWMFFQLSEGDLVVANKGTSEILAVGTVTDRVYEFRPDLGHYCHTVYVTWDTSYARKIEPQKNWAVVTVQRLDADMQERILMPKEKRQKGTVTAVDEIFLEIESALERKGQVILYGPPGTGKTYTARRFGVWWLSKRLGLDELSSLDMQAESFRDREKSLSQRAGADQRTERKGLLRLVTFHASYSYEDFIEGYRPVSSTAGTLSLELEDGLFKRFCQEAAQCPNEPFLLIIDEINRANVAKVLGELITLLEKDKRGLELILPQSKQPFSIPPNVFVIGTMNTADRSIKLLDAALRRRFAFIEVMPDLEKLAGAQAGDLPLDHFLEELNSRIARREGREKQIGHAYLLDKGKPISDPEAFAVCFKHDILPLLQEYCYDDYRAMAEFIGSVLVRDDQTLHSDILDDPDELLRTLSREFQARPSEQ